ncbi:MAG: hypothetical protein IKA48_01285 [Fibrobacter sp.]|nr:hypothetical protein [Fibrobacter sp.]
MAQEETEGTEKKPTREEILADRAEIRAKYSKAVAERYDEACDRDDELGANIVMFDEMEDGMVGTTVNAAGIVVPVYERELCIRSLARKFMKSGDYKDEDEANQAATEWFEFNTMGTLPYLKDQAPVIIDSFMRDSELWEGFLDE